MNDRHAHLPCMGPEGALTRCSGAAQREAT